MKYGKYCLSLNIIAAMCFFMAIINQPLAIILILAYAVMVEKDAWLTKYAVSALFLMAFSVFFTFVVDWFAMNFDFIKINAENIKNEFLFYYKITYIIYIVSALRGVELKDKIVDKFLKKDNT